MNLTFIPGTPICLVEGVFSEEDCAAFIRTIDADHAAGVLFEFPEGTASSTIDFWEDKNTYIDELTDFDKKILERMEKTKAEAFAEYLTALGDTGDYTLSIFAAAHRWVLGTKMYEHIDQYDGDSTVRHGLVMYLNEDMDGGEIYYPDYDVQIKPKPGLLVIHPGNVLHGVRPITRGVRYNMTGFAYVKS